MEVNSLAGPRGDRDGDRVDVAGKIIEFLEKNAATGHDPRPGPWLRPTA